MDWFRVENEAEIPSPSLLLYRARAEENIRRMIAIAGKPERLRPHVKTHKLGPLVRAQLDLGVTKFKCATIAEVEMTAEAAAGNSGGRRVGEPDAGAPDVLLAFPAIGPNVGRLFELRRHFPATTFSAIADSEVSIRALGEAARVANATLPVLLDLDCGMGRTGVVPGPDAERLYRLILETPGLLAGGLHAYDGHINEPDPVARAAQCDAAFAGVIALRDRLREKQLPVPRLVACGTPTFPIHARYADRELSPGTCVLWDFGYGDKFLDLPFEPAALLLTRVISKPGANRLCLDLGHKAVAAENPPPRVRLLELPDAVAIAHSEEHLVIETPRANEFQIGQCLHGIPRHVCPTVALHSEAWVVEHGAVRECWPIVARARRIHV